MANRDFEIEINNLFERLPVDRTDETFENLVKHSSVRVERIVSFGHRSPEAFWYDQDQHEWVVVLQGTATLSIQSETDTQTIDLKPGDSICLPAHQRHRVESTSEHEPTIWLAVHFGEDDG